MFMAFYFTNMLRCITVCLIFTFQKKKTKQKQNRVLIIATAVPADGIVVEPGVQKASS